MRVILDPVLRADATNGEGLAIYTAIEAAIGNAVCRSATIDARRWLLAVHADMTVRPYLDPVTGTERWAVVVDNDDEALMRDFPAKRHATRFYEDLVRSVAADYRCLHGTRQHVWDITDVEGVPSNGGFPDGR